MPSEAGEKVIKQSIVQILDAAGQARGCGLLVDNSRIVTCAHVIALALPGVDPAQHKKPEGPVRITFPYRGPQPDGSATVEVWWPVLDRPPTNLVEDVAILCLNHSPPDGAVPHPFLLQTEWAGRSYMVHGFTEAEPRGAWPHGRFKGETIGGWVQLLSSDGEDLQVDHGFSGAGVWDEQAGGFAGILVANKKRGTYVKSISYMIPSVVLKRAWQNLPLREGLACADRRAECLLDISTVTPPYKSSVTAEIRCTVSNFSDRRVIIASLELNVASCRPLARSQPTKPATLMDTGHLSASIRPSTDSVQLLRDQYYVEPSDIQGFIIKLDAEEGFAYDLRLLVTWKPIGQPPQVATSNLFSIEFPYHSLAGLRKLAALLAGQCKGSPN